VLNCTQNYIRFAVPPGDGAVHSLVLVVEGLSSNIVPLSYAPPSVSGVSPTFPTGACIAHVLMLVLCIAL
jgi:hypothetical protein